LKMTTTDPDSDHSLNINDCSKIEFRVSIENEAIFKLIRIEANPDVLSNRESCANLVLEALNEGMLLLIWSFYVVGFRKTHFKTVFCMQIGSTRIHVEYEQFAKDIYIYSYNELYTKQTSYLLAKYSSVLLQIHGGPTTTKTGSGTIELFDENVLIDSAKSVVKLSQIFDYKYNRYNYRVRLHSIIK
jgi:hypothetical protein